MHWHASGDCPAPFDRYRGDRWVDSACFGQHGFDCRPTSLKGQGARIDIALLNHTAGALARGYDLSEGVNPNDHCLVQLSLALPCAAQTWYMPRKIDSSQGFQCPPDDYRPPHAATDLVMRKCLLKTDIDGAYRAWCRGAEHLSELWF